MSTDRSTLEATLSAADFPASKEQIVDYAAGNGADEETLRALRALPLADYGNVEEVIRSAPLDKGIEEGQSSSDKAQQARQHTKDGLAEHETEVPSNPIVEELGENRGS
ncbi:DUF2795 domain-containing protein [Saccharopolyspora erythraea]|uniref:DUF2795 domain-containing protein n=1 Tax=Saccharopolyspora erythraea TaxID=1836 RepID=UPI001BA92578|nr:DUF2795 domain-containing protein [Saccharopolyspora erythraea]QUH03371.1 DUF2795 domain-containing protein [Saccharopolyspora erythraea]